MSAPLAIIVDDSLTLALLLSRQLEALGYQVQLREPVQLHSPMPATAELVCVELHGVGSNGFKILRALRRACQCRLLLLTASGRRSDIAWGRSAGADAVLQRPFSGDDLAACLAGEQSS